MRWNFASVKTGHIYLYGFIGEGGFFDMSEGLSLKSITNSVNGQGVVDEWEVHIHSDGGDVIEGMAIYDYIKSLGKPVTTINEGKCFSIATVILLAGSKRLMQPNAQLLIHNPWGMPTGDAETITEYANKLRKVEEQLKAIYKEHTTAGEDTIAKMMNEETMLTAAECLAMGFITEISEPLKAVALFIDKKEKMTKTVSLLNRVLAKLRGEPIKNLSLTLTDGSTVFIDTEADQPAVGDTVKIGGADGPDAPDGDHTLSDGTVITTVSGKITKITEPSNDDDMDAKALQELNDSIKALTEKVTGIENKFSGLETEISNLKTTQEEIKNLSAEAKEEKKEAEAILNKVQDVAKTINSVYTPERIAALNKWTEEQGEKKDSKTERLKELAKAEKEKRTATV